MTNLLRAERFGSKNEALFIHSLAQRTNQETSTYPKSFPIWKDLTRKSQKPTTLTTSSSFTTRDSLSELSSPLAAPSVLTVLVSRDTRWVS